MLRSPLALHLPDADSLTSAEIQAVQDLKPAALLVMCYAQWDSDRKEGRPGVSDQTSALVRYLDHDRLYVRFHADPHPPGYAHSHGGPEAWGRLCAQRMTQYYQPLQDAGVQLHAILANETDADYEGGLSVQEASIFHRRSMMEYAAKRPQDMLHVPAPTGAPSTHREHLQQYKRDGWLRSEYWIDGHGYNGDLENVLQVLREECPGYQYVITETNNLDNFGWPIDLLDVGMARDIVYFILNWARGGEGRVQPSTPDDSAKQMSLLRFPDRYAQFKATIRDTSPVPPPEPEPPEEPTVPDYPLGIDVSNNNGAVNWEQVASSGVQFAFAKISEGTYFRDGFFAENWAGMKANGILRGAYHFAMPSNSGARDEADFFVRSFGLLGSPLEPGDVVALDLEDPEASGDLSSWTLDWLEHVENLLGFKPMVYSSPAYIQEHHLERRPLIGEFGLWLASWGVATPPQAPPPWDLVAVHQTGVGPAGTIPGVQGEIDLNRFVGPIANFSKYGLPGDTPVPVPNPDPTPTPEPGSSGEIEALKIQVLKLLSDRGYLRDVVVPALRKELDTCRASLGALQAAIETLERETT